MPNDPEGKRLNRGGPVTILYENGKEVEKIPFEQASGLDHEIAIHFDRNGRGAKLRPSPPDGTHGWGCNLAIKRGDPAPDFEAKTLDGKTVSLKGEREKMLYLEFWSTGCGPCLGHLPKVREIHEKYGSQDFRVIGVSLDKDLKRLTRFVREKQLPFDVKFDGNGWDGPLATKYEIAGIPHAYLINRDGRVAARGQLEPKDIEALRR